MSDLKNAEIFAKVEKVLRNSNLSIEQKGRKIWKLIADETILICPTCKDFTSQTEKKMGYLRETNSEGDMVTCRDCNNKHHLKDFMSLEEESVEKASKKPEKQVTRAELIDLED
jgi:hypothetical protein